MKVSKPFYTSGLRFECQRCGACCRYEPGFVFLSKRDIGRLAEALKTEEKEFIDRYCRVVMYGGERRVSLKEKSNYDCIFWKDGGCLVYSARPFQCRSYPFWSTFLEGTSAWEHEKKSCPGIGKGPLYSKEEINRWRALKREEDYRYYPGEEGEC